MTSSTLRKGFVKRWRAEMQAMSKVVQCVISMGNILIEAKEALPHGEFEGMVREDFKISPGTARKLVLIARHPVLSNRSHVNDLPPSWGTLYELTRVPKPRLEAKLKDGTINPAMERSEVKALLPVRKGKIKFKTDEEETTIVSSDKTVDDESLADQLDEDPDAPFMAFMSRVGAALQMGHDAETVLLPRIIEITKPCLEDWNGMVKQTRRVAHQWIKLAEMVESTAAPVTRRKKSMFPTMEKQNGKEEKAH